MKKYFNFVNVPGLLLFVLIPTVQAQKKPNVVIMLADNLGYGDLSVYNGGIRGNMKTPNIDKLAGEDIRLTQFLVEPGCTLSRAGLSPTKISTHSFAEIRYTLIYYCLAHDYFVN